LVGCQVHRHPLTVHLHTFRANELPISRGVEWMVWYEVVGVGGDYDRGGGVSEVSGVIGWGK